MGPLVSHLSNLPPELVNRLQSEFQKLHQEYFLCHWEPSQLDAGRFAEIVLRILEYKSAGRFKPIGVQIKRQPVARAIKNNAALNESLRFHVLGLAELILDFRNKRNVAHPGTVIVNEMDAKFVLEAANWIVAELIRQETNLGPAEAQAEIHKIIERKVPIVEEIGGRLKVLNPSLTAWAKILVICYQKYPQSISEVDLRTWIEYDVSNMSRFRTILKKLSSEAFIDYGNGEVVLTKRGLVWVEKNIKFELEV